MHEKKELLLTNWLCSAKPAPPTSQMPQHFWDKSKLSTAALKLFWRRQVYTGYWLFPTLFFPPFYSVAQGIKVLVNLPLHDFMLRSTVSTVIGWFYLKMSARQVIPGGWILFICWIRLGTRQKVLQIKITLFTFSLGRFMWVQTKASTRL